MSDNWEEEENKLSQDAQNLNLNRGSQQQQQPSFNTFTPGAASFTPGATFQPGAQSFQPGAYAQYGQYGQQPYGGGGYPQYGGNQQYSQYGTGYGAQQGGYGQQYQQNYQQNYQQPTAAAPPQIAKRPAQGSSDLNKPIAYSGTPKTLSIGGDSSSASLNKPVAYSGAPKTLSIGGEAPKAKVLSIGTPAPAKQETKKEDTASTPAPAPISEAPAPKTATAPAVKAAKAADKAASGKNSPAPSSGRSSPTPEKKKDIDAVEKEVETAVDEDTLREIYGKEHVNVIMIGHVDAGKSTLGGSILVACDMIDARTLEKNKQEAIAIGNPSWYLSFALDSTASERTQGKTIEVGRAHFETDKRRYSILDAPGHKTYVPSMIGGASQADVGILVISARRGEYETGFEKGGQTREHAMLAKTQGVNKLIVAINKMDDPTVEWSEERYKECSTKLATFLKGTGYAPKDVFFLPVAGQSTTNIKARIPDGVAPWYKGPSLLEYLDSMKSFDRQLNAPFVMPVNAKWKDLGTIVEGRIEAGVIKKGASLLMMPNKQTCEVTAIFGDTEEEETVAQCGTLVKLRLRGIEEEEIMPGMVLCTQKRLIPSVQQFEAQIKILDLPAILSAGFQCVMHCHSAIEEVSFAALLHKLQKGTMRRSKVPPPFAKKGDAIIARLEVIGGSGSICVERFEDYPQLGRFTLRDQGTTIAIGKITKLIGAAETS